MAVLEPEGSNNILPMAEVWSVKQKPQNCAEM